MQIEADIAIIGAGVGGLWTAARLRQQGYACVVIDRQGIGAGQTIASQGIIHGGMKYALTGSPSDASREIARMPELWRASLEGRAHPDLSDVVVLSREQVMFTSGGFGARIAGAAASKVIRTQVTKVPAVDRPDGFGDVPKGVDVYAVHEPVLDPRSLSIVLSDAASPVVLVDDVRIGSTGVEGAGLDVRCACVVLAAGEGNERLLEASDLTREFASRGRVMQRRPLHMVFVRSEQLPMIYAHAIGAGTKPLATITSQRDEQGRVVWYVGGGISEEGVSLGRADLLEMARTRLAKLMPWVDFDGASWATFRIDRAEPAVQNDERPDGPFVVARGERPTVVLTWPVKLAFAPALSERVAEEVDRRPIPRRLHELDESIESWADRVGRASVAPLPWDGQEVEWN